MKFLTTIILLFLFVFTIKAQSSFFVDDAENVYKCGPDWVKKYAPEDTVGLIVAGGNGLGGNANQLNNPRAVIVDEKGDIFICDTENHRIQKWEKGAKTGITVAGGNGEGDAANQFNYPDGFLIDSKGDLIVGDLNNFRIQKWKFKSKEGITVAGGNGSIYSENQLYDPRGGFLLENDSTLLIVDCNGSKLIRWIMGKKSGTPVITRETDSNILFPVDVWKDKFGNIVFLDTEMGARYFLILPNSKKGIFIPKPIGNLFVRNGEFYLLTIENRILKYSFQRTEPILGQFLTAQTIIDGNAPSINNEFQISPGSKFYQDKKGNIYLIETEKNRILKVSTDGKSFTVVAGGNGEGDAATQLNKPQDIVIDDAENIYVVDTDNHRIQKFEKGSLIGITVAGGNGQGNNLNQLRWPSEMKFDSKGNLIIADYGNSRIQTWRLGEKAGVTIIGGNGSNQLNKPKNIFIDLNDNIYILDKYHERILKFNKSESIGKIILQKSNISNFTVDNSGNIYLSTIDYNLIKWSNDDQKLLYFKVTLGNQNLTWFVNLQIDQFGDLLFFDSIYPRILKLPSNIIKNNTLVNYIEAKTYIKFNKTKGDINQLDCPRNLFISDSGNILINDSKNNRIQKFNSSGKNAKTELDFSPEIFFIDKYENIYTNNLQNDGILKFTKDNKIGSTIAGGNGKGALSQQLYEPSGIFIDNENSLYILDSRNNRIQKWNIGDTKGQTILYLNTHSGDFNSQLFKCKKNNFYFFSYLDSGYRGQTVEEQFPNSNKSISIIKNLNPHDFTVNLIFDKNDNLLINNSNSILKYIHGKAVPDLVFSLNVSEEAKINNPIGGFTIAPNGDIYIADTGNNRILKVNPNVKLAEKSVSQKTLTEYNGAYFLTQTNELIAKIIPNESNLAMGEVTASVAVAAVQDPSFVKRHYKIEMNNPAHKAKISLYFTQAEFDAYNLLNEKKLPASPTDKTGIANIIITSAKVNSGRRALLLQTTIEIPDNQIVWNENLNVWEISFEDTGSKEYWLKTKFEFKKSSNPRPPRPFENTKYARLAIENEEINEFTSQIEVYPNPASKIFTLKINDSALLGTKASLQNEIGKIFKTFTLSKNMEEISIENLPTGIYFIQLVNGKVAKVVKN